MTTRPEPDTPQTPVPLSGTPLVVDMDGSLLRVDTLHEGLLKALVTRPALFPALLSTLRQGKAAFKRKLADHCLLETDSLPVSEEVMARIRAARAEGRPVILVSAADARQVEKVARDLGVFDAWYGTPPTNGARNLSGQAKADFLSEKYGRHGFDYIGDSTADVEVWRAARHAITLNASPGLRAQAEAVAGQVTHLGRDSFNIRACIRALRPHQWVKNILIFIPVLAAHAFETLGYGILAFIAFSMMASSVYLVNDMTDLAADRAHARKCKRPLAAGDISVAAGGIGAVLLVLTALAISLLLLPPAFFATLMIYLLSTLAYSLWLKRLPIIDIWTLAALYTLRILAGSAATGILPSPWLLTFSIFFFFALAAIKRLGEITDIQNSGKTSMPGRAYVPTDGIVVLGMAMASGYSSVVVFALYINSPAVEALYSSYQFLWCVPPALLFWISHITLMTTRGHMHDDPIIFAARDKVSWMVAIAIAATLFIANQSIL